MEKNTEMFYGIAFIPNQFCFRKKNGYNNFTTSCILKF